MISRGVIEFLAPRGSVPEGSAPGASFDAVCTFSVRRNGYVRLEKLGDTKVGGRQPEGESEGGEEQDESMEEDRSGKGG